MKSTIRTAIFGNGFARTTILPCLRQVNGVEVAGLSSPNQPRAAETARAFGIPRIEADHRELLDRVRPDLVFVVTPPLVHASMVIDALEAGCHVVCEKPMAMNAAEAERMAALARERPGQAALVDHELRFLPARRRMRELLRQGWIGRPWRAAYTVESPSRRSPEVPWSWWSDAAQGGGAWGALGSHAVDTLRWLLGEPTGPARGRLGVFHRERLDPATGSRRVATADEYAAALVPFPGGVEGAVIVSMVEPKRRHTIELIGEEGALRVAEQGALESWEGGRWKPVEVPEELPPAAELSIPDTDWARAFLLFARDLAAALLAGNPPPEEAATFEDGWRTQRVLDELRDRAGS